MPDLSAHLLTVLAAAGDISDDGHQWIEVMATGDNLRNGRWLFTVTEADLETYAASIRAKGDQTPLDYDHSYAEGNGTLASGWFTGDAEVRDTDAGKRLYARVKWTPKAVEAIQAGEYRFISPEFSFQEKDAKTGLMTKAREFLAATLTNRPFFKELAAVGAEGVVPVWDSLRSWSARVKAINAMLNPPSPQPEMDMVSRMQFYVEDITSDAVLIEECASDRYWVAAYQVDEQGAVTVAPATEWVEAREEWVAASAAFNEFNQARRAATEGDDIVSLNTVLAKSLGLADDATEDAITAALAAKDKTIADLTAKNTELAATANVSADLIAQAAAGAQAAEELKTMKVDALITAAVKDEKILPAVADVYRTMAATDFDGVKALLDATPAKATALAHEKGSDAARSHTGTHSTDAAAFDAGTVKASEDSLEMHAAAEAILATQGKLPGQYTADEYVAALEKATRDAAVA